MKNVVVTGMGIVSCIGTGLEEVLDSLRAGKSGIKHNPVYKEMGFRSHVSGSIDLNLSDLIDSPDCTYADSNRSDSICNNQWYLENLFK